MVSRSAAAAFARRHPIPAAIWLIAALAAIVLVGRLTIFMVDFAAEWRSITALRAVVFTSAALMFSLVFDGIWVTDPPRWVVVLTLANHMLALALNGWVVVRAISTTKATEAAAPRLATSSSSVS